MEKAPPYVIFMSDLHLGAKTPHLIDKFESFMGAHGPKADSIFILGDLFDLYLGQNDQRPSVKKIERILAQTAQHTQIFLQRGNRDFLLDQAFFKRTGTTCLNDESLIDIFNRPMLLAHGDTFCTLDIDYQKMRRLLHHKLGRKFPNWLPIKLKIYLATQIHQKGRQKMQKKPPEIFEENPLYLENLAAKQDFEFLIFGHTHQPGYRRYAGRHGFVLADWREHGYALMFNAHHQWQSLII